jgi:hypothetical protein
MKKKPSKFMVVALSVLSCMSTACAKQDSCAKNLARKDEIFSSLGTYIKAIANDDNNAVMDSTVMATKKTLDKSPGYDERQGKVNMDLSNLKTTQRDHSIRNIPYIKGILIGITTPKKYVLGCDTKNPTIKIQFGEFSKPYDEKLTYALFSFDENMKLNAGVIFRNNQEWEDVFNSIYRPKRAFEQAPPALIKAVAPMVKR